ncbi:uncharacterized protein LOC126987481 [Eriocheir sinensis]|uniref:uncharacterized protein LOC126987481 n=1 Tax=Eriocheir sinensis TaxID=95602 RepID=UPI0021C87033|nr:uncharacterized protein LOC126987481 [Eriocheir sinensis]
MAPPVPHDHHTPDPCPPHPRTQWLHQYHMTTTPLTPDHHTHVLSEPEILTAPELTHDRHAHAHVLSPPRPRPHKPPHLTPSHDLSVAEILTALRPHQYLARPRPPLTPTPLARHAHAHAHSPRSPRCLDAPRGRV